MEATRLQLAIGLIGTHTEEYFFTECLIFVGFCGGHGSVEGPERWLCHAD